MSVLECSEHVLCEYIIQCIGVLSQSVNQSLLLVVNRNSTLLRAVRAVCYTVMADVNCAGLAAEQ